MMRSILVADDHPVCSEMMKLAAQSIETATLVDVAGTLAEAEALLGSKAYDLVILDLMLPDASGLAVLASIRALRPRVPVAVVSSKDDLATIRQVARMGADGFMSKALPIERLKSALRVLLEGGQWFPAGIMSDEAGPQDEAAERVASLSRAQLRVLRAMASGRPNKQIAFDLELSEATVKSHLASAFRKLKVVNRTQALRAIALLDKA